MTKRMNFILAMSLMVQSVQAQELPYLSGAKKEAQVNLYATAALINTQAAVKVFEQKYPFIKVDFIRVGAEKMLSKIRTERAAGKILFDVIYGRGRSTADYPGCIAAIRVARGQSLSGEV